MTIPPELEALSPIGGTDAGGYFLLEPDVIVALPRPGYVQSGEGATRSLVEFDRITREAGRRAAIVVLVDRVVSQDPSRGGRVAPHRQRELVRSESASILREC